MNRKRVVWILLWMLAAGVMLSSCGSEVKSNSDFTEKQVAVYDKDEANKSEMTCLYRKDMPNIPFIDIEQYLDLVYCEDADYTLSGNGDKYSLTGKNKITGKTGSSLLIDTEKDSLTFEEYDDFVVGKPDGTATDYVQMTDVSGGDYPTLTYNLSDYDIDLISSDSRVFMPLSTLSDILSDSLTYAYYIDGNIYLNRVDSFTSEPTEYVKVLESSYYENLEREPDVAEYAYHELCFVLDNLYGKPGKAASQEFVESLSIKGLDETLKQGGTMEDIDLSLMRSYLTSTNKAEYAQGLFMLDNLLFDGGHNIISYAFFQVLQNDENWDQTAFSREYMKRFGDDGETNPALANLGLKFMDIFEKQDVLTGLRDEHFGEPVKYWEGNDGWNVAALYLFDDTAVFLFNKFSDDIILTNNGDRPFQEALEYAAENSCENFVLDLTTNGGGSDQVMGYMLSMIYGHDAPYYRIDADTGYQKENVFKADKNLDGSFDEKDEDIRYNFNYALMISGYSYSCGNTMPNLAHLEGIPLLGAATGGGGCNVSMLTLPGECTPYQLSTKWIMTDSAYQSIDEGINPDETMLKINGDQVTDASLYDPAQLTEAVISISSSASSTKSTGSPIPK